MTETVLKEIVHRAIRDGAYRAQLQRDPAGALAGFSLTTEERAAITGGDPARLTALGIDQRMSKAFAAGVLGDASKVIVIDGGAGATVIDEALGTERSFNWKTEQNIHSQAELSGVAEAAVVSEPAAERSFNWFVEQNLDGGDSLRTIDYPGDDEQQAVTADAETTYVTDLDQDANWDGGNELTEH